MARNVNVDDILKTLRALRDGHSRASAYYLLKRDHAKADFHYGYNMAVTDLYSAILDGDLDYLQYEGKQLARKIDMMAMRDFGSGVLDEDADTAYNKGQGGAT